MELGFGATGAWAAPWYEEAEAYRVLLAALDAGITHFDTAGFYAGGKADERLARLLERAEIEGRIDRAQLTVATKIGKKVTEGGRLVRDFGETGIREAVERHRRLFGWHPPDIVYLHGPDEQERHKCLPLLLRLKDDGVLGAIGECQDGPGLDRAADTGGIDIVMGRFNFLNTRTTSAFRVAKKNGKKVVAIAPLAQGLWRRSMMAPRRPADLWYLARALRRTPGEFLAAQRAGWIRHQPGWPPAHLALAFVRLNPAVDVVLTTSTRTAHIQDAADGAAREIPPEIADLLREKGAVTD